MIKIAELKKIKKLCFNKIASEAVERGKVVIGIKPIGLDLIEISTSNGHDYARMITENTSKGVVPEFYLGWIDFNKMCELFKNEVKIKKNENKVQVIEDDTILKFNTTTDGYNLNSNFKFNFDEAILLNTKDLFVLDDHKLIKKFAIVENKLISSNGEICIINNLDKDFGTEILQYTDKFPDGSWHINKNFNIVISENKEIAFTQRQATGDYPVGLLKMAKQPLSNSFQCNSKDLYEKIQQCSLIYEVMTIKFSEHELIIQSTGRDKCNATYKTTLPVKFDHIPTREGFAFSIKYLADFCKCTDKNGNLKVLFDDSPTVQMFRVENNKYTIFGMGIGK